MKSSNRLSDLRAPRDRRAGRGIALGAMLAGLFALTAAPGSSAAAVYYVDRASASCSDIGPGTEAQPYCSISAAVAARKGPGITIFVKPGTYPEQVTVPASGAAGNPFVIEALGQVVVDGADDFSGIASWAPVSGDVWLAAGVTWSPVQVFLDDVRLAASPGMPPASLTANSFVWVAGEGLYVNAGGGNPGAHQVRVGRRLYGFVAPTRSYVQISGFTILHAESRGVQLNNICTNFEISHNVIRFAGKYGIQANGGTAVRVDSNLVADNGDHGIVFLSGVTSSTIEDNESCRNRQPTTRFATGIYVYGSPGNVIQRNRVHDNQDSGLQIDSGSNDCVSVQNRSWNNGDHGFDQLSATNVAHVGDVAFGNVHAGFSVQGTATSGSLFDCIAADNGITAGSCDLSVSASATAGFTSNDNLFWNSTAQPPISFGGTPYATIAAFTSATGLDSRSIQANPLFLDAAAGDFHLKAGSPAIDNANSGVANWPTSDAEGRARLDDPATPNTGLGSLTYADRGALEFTFVLPPVAALTLTPSSGRAPLAVTADASLSHDPDGTVASYRFDFGDGTIVGPQVSPTAPHTYAQGGWTAAVTVTDNSGATATASVDLTVAVPDQPPNGVIDAPATNPTLYAGQTLNLMGSASDPDGNLPITYLWDLGGGAPNQTAQDPGLVVFPTAGTFTITLTATDALGEPDPTPDTRIVTVLPAPAGQLADGVHWTITGQTSVTLDWRGFGATVRYGISPTYGATVTGVTPTPIPFSSPGPYYEARITGLAQNTLYHYSIGGGPDHTFRTPPPRGSSSFTICATGDVGDAVSFPRMLPIQSDIAAAQPAFTLVVGDLTYANILGQQTVDEHFKDVMVWSQDAAYMPCWGNHDWDVGDDLRNYKGRFDLPNAQSTPGSPAVSCCGEDWYWFDYGNVRFIGYPEPYTGSVWADWSTAAGPLMDQAQADPAIEFIVTFGHRVAYSTGNYYPGNTVLKGVLDALGASHSKYVLNLNGHSHNYERTYPQSGVTHITVGNGGSGLEAAPGTCLWDGGCPPPAWSAYRAMHHGSLRLHFSPGVIQGEEICGPAGGTASNPNDITCDEGTVIDAFTIGSPLASADPVAGEGFRLISALPNPARHGLDVTFSLAERGWATLEVLDVAGRRVDRVELGPGPLTRTTHLGREIFPSPGLFYIRLRQAGHQASTRIAVIR